MKKTMFKKMVIVSFFAGTALTLQSCSKIENPENATSSNSNKEKVSSILTDANALEFTGDIHNLGMNASINSDSYAGKSDSEKYDYFISFTRQEFNTRSLPNNGIIAIDRNTYLPHLRNTSINALYDEALQSLTVAEISIITQLATIINLTDKAQKKNQITALKNSVFNSQTFTEEEKIFLLASISISVKSYDFWTTNTQHAGSAFHGVWKADWQGFWYGYHSSETNQNVWEQIETGMSTAQIASEFKRLENE